MMYLYLKILLFLSWMLLLVMVPDVSTVWPLWGFLALCYTQTLCSETLFLFILVGLGLILDHLNMMPLGMHVCAFLGVSSLNRHRVTRLKFFTVWQQWIWLSCLMFVYESVLCSIAYKMEIHAIYVDSFSSMILTILIAPLFNHVFNEKMFMRKKNQKAHYVL